LLMPISSISTALFGILSYVFMRYWNVGVFTDFGTIVFHVGVVLGIVAFVHGAVSFSKLGRELNTLYAAAVNADGTTNPEPVAALNNTLASFGTTLNIHAAMVIAAFICMTVGVSF
jgi:hypothetical protein